MFPQDTISALERNAAVFNSLLEALPSEIYLFKPNGDEWCILEIVCHLIDEEIEDFRARVRHTLETPHLQLASIDPKGWPKQRSYLSQNYDVKVKQFLKERNHSIAWLKALSNVNWKNYIENQDLGRMTAQTFLYNWLAHDFLHIRQINSLRRNFLAQNSNSDISYAGNW